jgi:hypothetical protein
MNNVLFRMIAVPVLCLAMCCGSGEANRTVEILKAEEQLELSDLWPGFEPQSVPVAVFDGERTILVRHPAPPEEFKPLPGRTGLWVYEGRHPLMSACTSGEMAGVRTALVTLGEGRENSVKEDAALLVHESFHVFAGPRHRDWGANEVEAFLYPVEDTLGLALRRVEEKALRRALAARDDRDAGGWTAGALEIRGRRFARLTAGQVHYERGIELSEGIAFYVENRSLGDGASLPLPEGAFGVEEIRRRAYDTGRAMCMLLDRLAPGWKNRLEEGPAVPLDSLLTETLAVRNAVPIPIPDDVLAEELKHAAGDVEVMLEERKHEVEQFLGAEGWTLEITAGEPDNVFGSVTFDPMNLKRVGRDEILHGRMLKLSGPSGTFEAMDCEVLTEAAGDHPMFSGIRRVVVSGLGREPVVREEDGKAVIEAPGVTASLAVTGVQREGRLVTVRMR